MRVILILAAVSLLFSACKKDEKSADEWHQLLVEKRQQIDQLIAGASCDDISEWSIFSHVMPYACSPTYFPMHPSIKEEFEKLWTDYLYYSQENTNAMIKEGVIIEPCWDDIWFHHAPLHLTCKEQKVSLVYIHDLDVEESKQQIAEIYPRIAAYITALTCNEDEHWTFTYLYNQDCGASFIPVRRTNEHLPIRTDVELYNAHRAKIVNKEKPD